VVLVAVEVAPLPAEMIGRKTISYNASFASCWLVNLAVKRPSKTPVKLAPFLNTVAHTPSTNLRTLLALLGLVRHPRSQELLPSS
jgi:hypothetical protein